MKRRLLWLAVPVLLIGAIAMVIDSAWLRDQLRTRIIAAVNRATGGRAELSDLDFSLLRMSATASGFTLHGREHAGQAPLFEAARVGVSVEWLNWFSPRLRLAAVDVARPRFRMYVYPDGSTNLPSPQPLRPRGDFIETLLNARIGTLTLTGGQFVYDSRVIPFSLRAEDVQANLTYDARQPSYRAGLSAGAVHLPGRLHPSVIASVVLEHGRVRVERGQVRLGESHAEFSGSIEDVLHPRIRFDYRAAALLRDIEVSPVREGFATAAGVFTYSAGPGLRLDGRLHAEQLAYAIHGFHFRRVAADADYVLTPARLALARIRMRSPYGDWAGEGDLRDWRDFSLAGRVTRGPLAKLQAMFVERPHPWDAGVTGPLSLTGQLYASGAANLRAEARLHVEPSEGQLPMRGELNVLWRQDCACVDFGTSTLSTPTASLTFHGVLGQHLEAELSSTNLEELSPLIALAAGRNEVRLPLTLDHGRAHVAAVVNGPLVNPDIRGSVQLDSVVYSSVRYDRVTAAVHLTSTQLEIADLVSTHNAGRTLGNLKLALDAWQPVPASALDADVTIERGDVARLARLLGADLPVSGSIEVRARLNGTLGAPAGALHWTISGGSFSTERFEHLAGDLNLSPDGLLNGSLTADHARLSLSGQWRHPTGDLANGTLDLRAALAALPLAEIEALQSARPGLSGELQGDVRAVVVLTGASVALRSLDGTLHAAGVHLGSRNLGALNVRGESKAGTLTVQATLAVPQGVIQGDARIRLAGNFPAEGRVHLPRLTFGLLHDLFADPGAEPWPVRGFLDGEATWSGPLADPHHIFARLTVASLQVRPRQQDLLENQVDTSELALRNSVPLIFELANGVARVRQAKFTALETDLTLTGSYTPGARSPWAIDIDGKANLAVLGSFYKDLLASGSAGIRAALRGEAASPRITGRMTISNASFYLKDLPNGIEQAEGTILFDQNRANIERFEGRTGAGTFRLGGFVGFHADELIYRLQAQASSVRVRYPEGVSTTLNADISLTGSTRRALLAGTITVERSGFNVSSDLASLVGSTGNPIPTAATQNEFLRNLQFDIRVRTSPDAVFLSSYTSGVQTEADLRLRGSPAKPILIGSIKANQGQVNFLGNRYTISRGEVLFYNTAVVQPQIDLDLETRLRGITVYLNIAGPLSRINVNYRSDPPLQSSEILALLTVGRAPSTTTTSIVTSDRIRTQTEMENSAATNTLLGGALSSALSRRAERLFGASRIRIDPSATGVDNLPSARLSIEQSISRDITLTYITNLNRSQQQVVQLEWDLNRQWSLIAIKDENGTFAVDFLFRRRFN